MKKIAVTGGLSSGKTSVCQILKSFGAYVVNADEIVHQLLSPNTVLGKKVVSLLGEEIVTNNEIDRKKIAKIVFSHLDKLRALEDLIHPAVLQEIERRYQEIKNQKIYSLFVAEIPLLYESKSESSFDVIVTVVADKEKCLNRFHQMTGYTEEEYERRMARQLSPEHKALKANYLIVNNGDLNELRDNVIKFKQTLPLI